MSPWLSRNPSPVPLTSPLTAEVAHQIEAVSEHAYTLAVARILDYKGNTLSADHHLALRRMAVGFSYLAAKVCTGRVAYSIDIGGGKSVMIAAWIAALYKFRDEIPWTCAVAASQVESLCTMRRSLHLNYGIPYEWSGLWHSLGDPSSKANEGKNIMLSDTETQLAERRVALVTHARIATPAALDRLNTYRAPEWDAPSGEPQTRGVVLFDEALYTSAHFTANLLDLESDIGTVGPQVRKRFGSRPNDPTVHHFTGMVDYLTDSFKILDAESKELDYRAPKIITLPEITDEQRTNFLAAYHSMLGYVPGLMGAAREVIEAGYLPVTLIKANLGNAAITFATAVPDALNRMAILDASYQIDKLAQNDATITSDPLCPKAVKDYHTMTIMALQRGAGRKAIYTNVGDMLTTNETDSICKAVVEVVTALPADEAVLLFTFLPRKFKGKILDVRTILETHLVAAGVDLNATVTAQDETGVYTQRPRINFSTWGKERGSNAFAYCRNVMLVGILTRDEAEMRSALHAAHRSLTANVTTSDVRAAILSADAIVTQQALARGNIRQTQHGNAGVMKAWLFHRNVRALRVDLDRVFPNARWQKWETQYLRELQVKVNDLADGIKEYLTELPATTKTVNVTDLRQRLRMLTTDGVIDKTFYRAVAVALLSDDVKWKSAKRRLVRLTN